ncbi:RES domain-containing protein [Pseudomonas sp. Z3-6]|uniref:RES domain-containing protein n=1 Tax=Pseudomonas sp. Z3-6 TaxID=2817411 RepID=UPI003DA82320
MFQRRCAAGPQSSIAAGRRHRAPGITRKQLIDTEKEHYPATRKWAEAIHRQCPDAQGLSWISRQDDSARAIVLFGDRIPEGALHPRGRHAA